MSVRAISLCCSLRGFPNKHRKNKSKKSTCKLLHLFTQTFGQSFRQRAKETHGYNPELSCALRSKGQTRTPNGWWPLLQNYDVYIYIRVYIYIYLYYVRRSKPIIVVTVTCCWSSLDQDGRFPTVKVFVEFWRYFAGLHVGLPVCFPVDIIIVICEGRDIITCKYLYSHVFRCLMILFWYFPIQDWLWQPIRISERPVPL